MSAELVKLGLIVGAELAPRVIRAIHEITDDADVAMEEIEAQEAESLRAEAEWKKVRDAALKEAGYETPANNNTDDPDSATN